MCSTAVVLDTGGYWEEVTERRYVCNAQPREVMVEGSRGEYTSATASEVRQRGNMATECVVKKQDPKNDKDNRV